MVNGPGSILLIVQSLLELLHLVERPVFGAEGQLLLASLSLRLEKRLVPFPVLIAGGAQEIRVERRTAAATLLAVHHVRIMRFM